MNSRILRRGRRERGVVLFIALIVLVAMSLAGIALIRGVDTANLIAGNLAFKQGATLAGDLAVEQARTLLLGQTASALQNDNLGTGTSYYWANSQVAITDFTGSTTSTADDYNWANAASTTDASGNTIQYVIHRLCDTAGNPSTVNCMRSTTAGGTGQHQGRRHLQHDGALEFSTGLLPSHREDRRAAQHYGLCASGLQLIYVGSIA